MMIQDTSIEAFQEIQDELGNRQKEVLFLFKLHDTDFTNSEVAQRLNLPINTVTPRCKELREKGHLRAIKKRKCKVTGRTCIAWGLNKQQLELAI